MKRFLTLLILMLFYPSLNCFAQNNCIARFPFEEGSGIIATDISGNGRNGDIYGSVKWVDGKIGKALELNPETGSYIKLPDNFLNGVKSFTFTCWIYWNGLGEKDNLYEQRIIDFHTFEKTGDNQNNNRLFWMTPAGGNENNLLYMENYSDKNGTASLNSSKRLPAKQWTHIAWIIDSQNQSSVLYINGAQTASTTGWQHNPDELKLSTFYIGKSAWGVHPPLDAILDEIAFFDTALTAPQIKDIMNNKIPFSQAETSKLPVSSDIISSAVSIVSGSATAPVLTNSNNITSESIASGAVIDDNKKPPSAAVITVIILAATAAGTVIYFIIKKSKSKL